MMKWQESGLRNTQSDGIEVFLSIYCVLFVSPSQQYVIECEGGLIFNILTIYIYNVYISRSLKKYGNLGFRGHNCTLYFVRTIQNSRCMFPLFALRRLGLAAKSVLKSVKLYTSNTRS